MNIFDPSLRIPALPTKTSACAAQRVRASRSSPASTESAERAGSEEVSRRADLGEVGFLWSLRWRTRCASHRLTERKPQQKGFPMRFCGDGTPPRPHALRPQRCVGSGGSARHAAARKSALLNGLQRKCPATRPPRGPEVGRTLRGGKARGSARVGSPSGEAAKLRP